MNEVAGTQPRERITDERLAVLAKNDEHAFTILHGRYKNIRFGLAQDRYAPGVDRDDMLQWAAIALWHAVRTYDPDRGIPFAPFARMVISRKLITVVKLAHGTNQGPLNTALSLDDVHGTDDPGDGSPLEALLEDRHAVDPAVALERKDQLAAVVRVVTELPARQRQAVLGLMNGETYLQIADRLDAPAEAYANVTRRSKAVDNALQLARRKVLRALADLEDAA